MRTLENIHLTLTLARAGAGYTVSVSAGHMTRDTPRTVFSEPSSAIFAGCEVLARDPFAENALVFYDGSYAIVDVHVPRGYDALQWRPLAEEDAA